MVKTFTSTYNPAFTYTYDPIVYTIQALPLQPIHPFAKCPRPYNLYSLKAKPDTDTITGYVFETSYAPFLCEHITCIFSSTRDIGPMLKIMVGTNSKEKAEDEVDNISSTLLHRGLDDEAFTIEIPLVDITTHADDILVQASDGILTVILTIDRRDDIEVDIPVNF